MEEDKTDNMLTEITQAFDEAEERAAGLGVRFLIEELRQHVMDMLTSSPTEIPVKSVHFITEEEADVSRSYWNGKFPLETARKSIEDAMLPFIVGKALNVPVRSDGRISINRLEVIEAVYRNGRKMSEGYHYHQLLEEGRLVWQDWDKQVYEEGDILTADVRAAGDQEGKK